jgi:polyisoprenoid-binding protein YceI
MKNFILILIFLFASIFLQAQEHFVDKQKNNLVKFISKTPIESFEGVTNQIDGYMYWDNDDLTNKSQLYFEVNLDALDTGIGLRNRHMKENYLETFRYPYAQFNGKVVKEEKVSDIKSKVTVEGEMFIHGVAKKINLQGTVEKNKPSYRIQTEFTIKLSDFKIEVPSLMFMRISEEIRLVLDFFIKEKK